MKNILIFFLFLFIGTAAIAQDGQLIIDGLNDDGSENIMVLKKVELEGSLTYVVKKNRDGISDKLKERKSFYLHPNRCLHKQLYG